MTRTGPRIAATVEAKIVADIVSGRLTAGTRLLPEHELAKSLGVSRGIVREVLQSLRGRGIIGTRRGAAGGSFVQAIDTSIVTDAILMLVRVNGASLENVVEARRLIAPAIAELAAVNAREEDIAFLDARISEVRQGISEGRLDSQPMMQFHLRLCELTRNPILEAVARPLTEVVGVFLARWWAQDQRSNLGPVVEMHQDLLDALIRRDPALARDRMAALMGETAQPSRPSHASARPSQ